ncbi:hypothetical protein Tco_1235065 [Tanacetum coccineum]
MGETGGTCGSVEEESRENNGAVFEGHVSWVWTRRATLSLGGPGQTTTLLWTGLGQHGSRRMAISVDRIHQQYQKENVVDFDFDVVGLVVATMIDGGGSDEESKEFQKLSLTDMPPQPQVPKKKVDDGGKELEQKPVAARAITRLKVVLIPDKTPDDYSAIPYTYSPLNPEWFKELEEKYKDFACTTCLSRSE